MGIFNHTFLNYCFAMTAMSLAILLTDLLLRERISCGTIIDALFPGNHVRLYNNIDPRSHHAACVLAAPF